MKIFTTILGLGVLLASTAYADISDSGNLTIGGQGVVTGSMTVQGGGGLLVSYGVTASSVVASSATLTATGSGIYALTSSTGIHVLNGKIKLDSGAYVQWPDGTTSTTAVSGSSGNSFSTATYQHNPWLGSSDVAIDTTMVGGITAISVDGTTQSSGCVVELHYDKTRGYMVLTSTASDPYYVNLGSFCVLYEACVPLTPCKCITRGLVRIKGNGGSGIGQAVTTSATPCNSSNNNSGPGSNGSFGHYVQCDGTSPYWCYALMHGP